MIDAVRNFVHFLSITAIAVALLIIIIAIIRPRLLHFLLREFAERKYALVFGVFGVLLCSTVFLATQQPKQATYESHTERKIAQVMPRVEDSDSEPINTIINEATETEQIPFTKQTVEDPNLSTDQTKITQAGKNGVKTRTYNVTIVNGTETDRVLKSEIIIDQTPEITTIGTLQPKVTEPTAPPATTQPTKETKSYNTRVSCKNNASNLRISICLPNF